MTRPFQRTAKCPNCHYDIPLEDEISHWSRHHPELNSEDGFTYMDKDLICHRFKTTHGREFQCLMFVEFKSRGGALKKSQKDTMWIVDQMFRTDTTTPTKKAGLHCGLVPSRVWSEASKMWVAVKAFGFHLCVLSGRTPDDSDRILWDGKEITLADLIKLLRFDLDPRTLRPMDWRIHHRKEAVPELAL